MHVSHSMFLFNFQALLSLWRTLYSIHAVCGFAFSWEYHFFPIDKRKVLFDQTNEHLVAAKHINIRSLFHCILRTFLQPPPPHYYLSFMELSFRYQLWRFSLANYLPFALNIIGFFFFFNCHIWLPHMLSSEDDTFVMTVGSPQMDLP